MNKISKKSTRLTVSDYTAGILQGNRSILARAITLIESTKPEHQKDAQALLDNLLPASGNSIRLGISGVPGVGKSTFIEALGMHLVKKEHKLAVLAVDPSSTRTGGSILGDKTRMQNLSMDANAFIRPSPTSGTLGGVAHATREAIVLCEAAGFDVIIVETVGVGQSEITISEMVDFYLLLMLPGAGDELQGIKKGVLEIADMIAVNKTDNEFVLKAQQAASAYRSALNVLSPFSANWNPPVVTCSALTNTGIDDIWKNILEYQTTMLDTSEWNEKRVRQQVNWMHAIVRGKLLSKLSSDKILIEKINESEHAVKTGNKTPLNAANDILSLL